MSERMSDAEFADAVRLVTQGMENAYCGESEWLAICAELDRARAAEVELLEGRDQWIPRTGKPACPGQYLVALWPRGATGQMVSPPTLALLQWDGTRWVGDYSRWTVDCHYRLPHIHYEVAP